MLGRCAVLDRRAAWTAKQFTLVAAAGLRHRLKHPGVRDDRLAEAHAASWPHGHRRRRTGRSCRGADDNTRDHLRGNRTAEARIRADDNVAAQQRRLHRAVLSLNFRRKIHRALDVRQAAKWWCAFVVGGCVARGWGHSTPAVSARYSIIIVLYECRCSARRRRGGSALQACMRPPCALGRCISTFTCPSTKYADHIWVYYY